jgi:hypothetical protein
MLAVADLTQIQHLPLHHLATSTALALNNIPVAMFFAVLQASIESQEHDATQTTLNRTDQKDTWSTLQTIYDRPPLIRLAFIRLHPTKIVVEWRQLRKLG